MSHPKTKMLMHGRCTAALMMSWSKTATSIATPIGTAHLGQELNSRKKRGIIYMVKELNSSHRPGDLKKLGESPCG